MKKLTIAAMTIGMLAISGLQASEVTIEGKAVCARCNLKSAKSCATVLQVKDGDATKDYYIEGKLAKEIKGKSGTVKGDLKEVDGKMIVTATEVTVSK